MGPRRRVAAAAKAEAASLNRKRKKSELDNDAKLTEAGTVIRLRTLCLDILQSDPPVLLARFRSLLAPANDIGQRGKSSSNRQ